MFLDKNSKKRVLVENKLLPYNNQLILNHELVRFRGSLSIIQSKGILILLKTAIDEIKDLHDNDKEEFHISTDLFLDMMYGCDRPKESKLKTISRIDKAMTHILDIKYEFGKYMEINKSIFIQEFGIKNDQIKFVFSRYTKRHLKPLGQALIINDFPLLMSFKIQPARMLYMHLMMWKSIGKTIISLEDLKSFLGVDGNITYDKVHQLKIRVIDKAVEEINEKTKMNVSYTEIKNGNTIEEFLFKFDNNKEALERK